MSNLPIGSGTMENDLHDPTIEEARAEALREIAMEDLENQHFKWGEPPAGRSKMQPMKKQKYDIREYTDWKTKLKEMRIR